MAGEEAGMIRIVTSFGPSRILRQQDCLKTWLERGCSVTAVQSEGEADLLRYHFPEVEFIETDKVGDLFDCPKLPRISELIRLGSESPVLILNSDVHIEGEALKTIWSDIGPKKLKVGIRWNIRSMQMRKFKIPTLFKWGIDAFWITPELASAIPDIGLAIGCPVWDYWLVWFAMENGFGLEVDTSKTLWHIDHKQNWTRGSYRKGFEIVRDHYGITESFLTNYIQKVTNRTHIKR